MAAFTDQYPNYVPALRKGFALLELLADAGPLSLAQVERASGLNRTMSYRLLRVMGELGYVEHDVEHHTYGLGLRVLELGAAVAERLHFAEIAWPSLVALREELQETVAVGVMTGGEAVYLGLLESPRMPGVPARPGGSDPLHATAVGKAILAFQSPRERRRKLAALHPLPRLTPRTIVDPGALAFELKRSRDRGYAVEDEENEVGVRGVAVPVLAENGQPLAALGLAGPVARIDLNHAGRIAERLWLASREMSRGMSHAPRRLAS